MPAIFFFDPKIHLRSSFFHIFSKKCKKRHLPLDFRGQGPQSGKYLFEKSFEPKAGLSPRDPAEHKNRNVQIWSKSDKIRMHRRVVAVVGWRRVVGRSGKSAGGRARRNRSDVRREAAVAAPRSGSLRAAPLQHRALPQSRHPSPRRLHPPAPRPGAG